MSKVMIAITTSISIRLNAFTLFDVGMTKAFLSIAMH